MTATKLDELFDFVGIAEKKGFLNANTANGRRTACTKLFSVLDEDQKTVEYVRDHLDVIKGQFQRLNNDVLGQTVDEYGRRVAKVLSEFTKWSADRAAWEREVTAKPAKVNGDGAEKRARPEKAKPAAGVNATSVPENMRVIEVPLRPGVEATVIIPRDLTFAQVKRIALAILPYASDWDPTAMPAQQVLPIADEQLDRRF